MFPRLSIKYSAENWEKINILLRKITVWTCYHTDSLLIVCVYYIYSCAFGSDEINLSNQKI